MPAVIEERRRRQILQLVWTRTDFQPAAKTQRFDQTRGLTPAAKAPCRECVQGWVCDRFNRRRPCLVCGGKPAGDGKPAKGGRGWVYVDPMDTLREPIRTDHRDLPTKPAQSVVCDSCGGQGVGGAHLRNLEDPSSEYRDACGYCGGSGRRAVARFDLQLAWATDGRETRQEQLARQRAAGSYDELERALAVLPGSMVLAVTRAADPRTRSRDTLADAGLEVLDHLLPDTLRVPRIVRVAWVDLRDRPTLAVGKGAGAALIAKRDREIRKHDRDGKPRQWIAAEYGISVALVKLIVNGKHEEAA